jgi:diadenosine tetraphosphate (Ap4A) HIT family hydrolase
MSDDTFRLHPQLEADTCFIADWPLCRVLLLNDARFPWIVLVPRRADVTEPFDLSAVDQLQLHRESMALGQWMKAEFAADKMNIAALGNQVPQLHVHHIARFRDDPMFPAPVWGSAAQRYSAEALLEQREWLAASLGAEFFDDLL